MLITWKLPKSIAGRTKRPRGPRVWYPDLTQRNKKKQDHTSRFSKSVKQTNHSLLILV